MNKFLAGSKAVGSGSGCGNGSKSGCSSSPLVASQQSASLSAMMAAREAQDAMWKQPVPVPTQQIPASQKSGSGGQIVVYHQQQQTIQPSNRSADIDMILKGDY